MDNLDQKLADNLLAMNKIPANSNDIYEYPDFGGKLSIPLLSTNGREQFLLDINRKKRLFVHICG